MAGRQDSHSYSCSNLDKTAVESDHCGIVLAEVALDTSSAVVVVVDDKMMGLVVVETTADETPSKNSWYLYPDIDADRIVASAYSYLSSFSAAEEAGCRCRLENENSG